MRWYSRLGGLGRMVLIVVVPQVLVIIAAVVVVATGHPDGAQIVGMMGSMGAMLLLSVPWVVFVDSRNRWPGLRARDRYVKIMTFQR